LREIFARYQAMPEVDEASVQTVLERFDVSKCSKGVERE
jgi:hypothetical protein